MEETLASDTQKAKQLTPKEVHEQSLELSKSASGIIPFMEGEIVRLEEESAKFESGEQENAEFTPFRLRQGVYGQRQADVQMIRIKLPGGRVTPEALDVLSDISDSYAPLHKGHITTRENIQFHHIPLPECPDVIRMLGEVGLSTREACGNTVRNVVGSPSAGVCEDEIFDPTPYLAAYVRFGVRNPLTQSFPRKFKTAFTGCESHDAVAAAIQDLTYVSQIKNIDGQPKKGFKVFVGGGTSIMPRLAKPLYEFLPEEDYLRLAQAIWTVFNNAESLRKNRMMARLKVLIDRIGLDEFRGLVEAELSQIGPIDPSPYMDITDLQREIPPVSNGNGSNGFSSNEQSEFNKWKESNVFKQKQEGYSLVYVKPVRGDLTAEQFKGLATILRNFTGGRASATQEQNLALRWVPEDQLGKLWVALKDLGLADPGALTIANVVSCPGTDSCKLGITASMGLAKAIGEEVNSWGELLDDNGVKKIRIKMSGCPNGCGLHHIANIGFHGAAVKGPEGQQIPSYELFLGGNYGDNQVEDSRIGSRIPKVKVPAKMVPGVVRQITNYYKNERSDESEEFNQFLDRVGLEGITEVASKAAEVSETAEPGSDLYFDWERTNAYVLERGEGECAV
ncbi:MAG: ferredoxin--nitrite reductase [Chloroflexi bacterium]|nr:ferredoxin--nitrite reductase [Chloroflexota bacterium]